jgi:hypothetical protein
VKKADGGYEIKTVATILKDHQQRPQARSNI